MDSNINNNFLPPTSTTSPNPFFDLPANFSTWTPPPEPTATHQHQHHHHPPPLATSASPNPVGATSRPKKRSRASRRAPTTVLTTDTTNFRAMVQEFTGIPSPPFPTSSSTTPTSAPTFRHFRHFLHPSLPLPPPPPHPSLNFHSLLNLPSSSSGELRLPGVIGSADAAAPANPIASNIHNFSVSAAEKAGNTTAAETMESWICSSD